MKPNRCTPLNHKVFQNLKKKVFSVPMYLIPDTVLKKYKASNTFKFPLE